MTSDKLRKQMLAIRDCMSVNEVEQYSAAIDERLFAYIDEHPAIRSILCFYPKGNEVALLPLYEKLAGMYRLYFPVTDDAAIAFFQVSSMEPNRFAPGRFGIREPVERGRAFPADAREELSTVAIVPGVAFDDRTRGRIGYGRGYYDRFLTAHPDIYKIGVCYDFQLADGLPQHDGDVPMDMLFTNTDSYE